MGSPCNFIKNRVVGTLGATENESSRLVHDGLKFFQEIIKGSQKKIIAIINSRNNKRVFKCNKTILI